MWFVLGGLLALAGVCPFVGSLADLIGRRYVAMLGATLLVVGTVVATTAKTMGGFIGEYSSSICVVLRSDKRQLE